MPATGIRPETAMAERFNDKHHRDHVKPWPTVHNPAERDSFQYPLEGYKSLNSS